MKKLSILLLIAFVMLFVAQSQAQIAVSLTEEREVWKDYRTTTQITSTGKDTTATFELLKPSKWETAYITVWVASQDADSCNISTTLRGGYEDDWDGANWFAVDGPDTGTTANYGINEVQFTVESNDKPYLYWQLILAGLTGHTIEASNTVKVWVMITYKWID